MKRVLIVDDEQIVLDVLQRILNRIGCETTIIESGHEAMAAYNKNDYDLVLLDVLMPELNGFDIAKKIKLVNPEQKIVMVTGLGEDAAIHQAGAENVIVDSVLSKPFSFEKVKRILEDTLGTPIAV